jgi:hypothetical protein
MLLLFSGRSTDVSDSGHPAPVVTNSSATTHKRASGARRGMAVGVMGADCRSNRGRATLGAGVWR